LSHGTYVWLSVPAAVETNGTAFISTGWTGTGSAAGSGTTTDTGFTLMANSTLTWNWTLLAVSATLEAGGSQIMLQWPSVAGKYYDVLFATNLQAGFVPAASNLSGAPPTNFYQGALGPAHAGFYKVQMK
jgi:hypothetical protein